MSTPPERTALYRFYDADGALLYIGISRDPDGRWKAHRDTRQEWIPMAAARRLEWFDDRPTAEAAEVVAIRGERPRFNRAHNQDRVAFDPVQWPRLAENINKIPQLASLMRSEIKSGQWRTGQMIPHLRVIAEAVGVGRSTAVKATAALQREGLLVFRAGHGLFVARPESRPRPKLLFDSLLSPA